MAAGCGGRDGRGSGADKVDDGGDESIFNWNKIPYTSFYIYILSKAQQRILLLYMYNMIYKYNDLKIIRLNSNFFNQIMFY